MDLIPKGNLVPFQYFIGMILVAALYLCAIIFQEKPFKNLIGASLKIFSVRSYLRTNYPLYSRGGWFIFIGSILSLLLTASLFYEAYYQHVELDVQINISLVVLSILFLPVIILLFFINLNNQNKNLFALVEIQFLAIHLWGVFGFISMLLWSVYKIDTHGSMLLFLVFFGLTYLLRIIKSIIYSFGAGIKWYYIILYFCTLEIMPIVILSSLISWEVKDFFKIIN